ncbi:MULTISPECIES: TerC family protein [unclassified Polaribacter]|uniref:TerC family protein n=1 Tax=unclassified Polaribacter TaxID=196858 RepID=UPI0011BF890C|nr:MULTISPECIES: TerC family protein [unclassified Polaribacter]TXD51703.1 TerC family protein [Polaribacter sp. IC063]TXD59546.1 TerC family protein [Polaribacter sp. IC066]
MEIFLQADTWIALLTLTFLEIILGIDNVIFISISANKLPENQVRKATLLGLALAMITRILLLFSVSYLIALKDPFFTVDMGWFKTGLTGQSIILFLGGIFLLYKSTKEIREKVENTNEAQVIKSPKVISFNSVILQIILIDIVFSFDSILTAVGMTNGVDGALIIMVIAVIVSIIIMMIFSQPISKYVNRNPTVQMLALSFLILIGFMLITEGAHLSHTEFFNKTVGVIPKGYLYFAIAFSLGVEMLNLRVRKKK